MKLIDLKCPNCNADMKVNSALKQCNCNYCGHTMLIDEEIQKIKIENSFELGYNAELGRMKAKADIRDAQLQDLKDKMDNQADKIRQSRQELKKPALVIGIVFIVLSVILTLLSFCVAVIDIKHLPMFIMCTICLIASIIIVAWAKSK